MESTRSPASPTESWRNKNANVRCHGPSTAESAAVCGHPGFASNLVRSASGRSANWHMHRKRKGSVMILQEETTARRPRFSF